MVDRDDIIELIPHYIAMVVLVLVIMSAIRTVVEPMHVLVEFALILILVFSYRPIVARVEMIPTPDAWKNVENE